MKLKDFYNQLINDVVNHPEILNYDMAAAISAERILEVDCLNTDEDPVVIGVK